MKRWPHEAQSGGWCPPRCGSERSARFNLGRDRPHEDAPGQPWNLSPAGLVAWTGTSLDERSGLDQQSPVARAAADEQEEYSLDTSFLRR
jgi:hypothetical protein